jgi:hypothetical protein
MSKAAQAGINLTVILICRTSTLESAEEKETLKQ